MQSLFSQQLNRIKITIRIKNLEEMIRQIGIEIINLKGELPKIFHLFVVESKMKDKVNHLLQIVTDKNTRKKI